VSKRQFHWRLGRPVVACSAVARWLVAAVVWTVGTLGLDFPSGEQIEPLKVAIKFVVGLAFGCFVAVVGRSLKARNWSKPAVWPTPMNVQHAILTEQPPAGHLLALSAPAPWP
jgi:hypothetical protein